MLLSAGLPGDWKKIGSPVHVILGLQGRETSEVRGEESGWHGTGGTRPFTPVFVILPHSSGDLHSRHPI